MTEAKREENLKTLASTDDFHSVYEQERDTLSWILQGIISLTLKIQKTSMIFLIQILMKDNLENLKKKMAFRLKKAQRYLKIEVY